MDPDIAGTNSIRGEILLRSQHFIINVFWILLNALTYTVVSAITRSRSILLRNREKKVAFVFYCPRFHRHSDFKARIHQLISILHVKELNKTGFSRSREKDTEYSAVMGSNLKKAVTHSAVGDRKLRFCKKLWNKQFKSHNCG